jgi:hypothetical protein
MQQFIKVAMVGAAENCAVMLAVFVLPGVAMAWPIFALAFEVVSAPTVVSFSAEGQASG